MVDKKSNNYISLQEAAKTCQYSQEYLSLRARKGKLKAVKLERNWVTKKEWLEEYITNIEKDKSGEDSEELKKNYISLQDAANHCHYSQEYLSLRARQGKLKAIKIGKNWTTKKEWLQEYIAKVEEYKGTVYKIRPKEIKEAIRQETKEKIKEKKKILPPKNLPVGEFEFFLPKRFVKKPILRPVFTFSLFFVLLIVSGVLNKGVLQNISKDILHFNQTINETEKIIIDEATESVRQTFDIVSKRASKIASKITEDGINAAAIENIIIVFNGYSQWLDANSKNTISKIQNFPPILAIKKIIKFVWQNIRKEYIAARDFTKKKVAFIQNLVFQFGRNLSQGIKTSYLKIASDLGKDFQAIVGSFRQTGEFISRPFKFVYQFAKQFYQISLFVEKPEKKEGMVVIPSTEEDEAVKQRIKENFSDEVKVELTDESSGIITPIFRDGEGEKYMYLLVPVNKK